MAKLRPKMAARGFASVGGVICLSLFGAHAALASRTPHATEAAMIRQAIFSRYATYNVRPAVGTIRVGSLPGHDAREGGDGFAIASVALEKHLAYEPRGLAVLLEWWGPQPTLHVTGGWHIAAISHSACLSVPCADTSGCGSYRAKLYKDLGIKDCLPT